MRIYIPVVFLFIALSLMGCSRDHSSDPAFQPRPEDKAREEAMAKKVSELKKQNPGMSEEALAMRARMKP